MNQEELNHFQTKTELWVDDYYRVHTSHDVTLYMHVFAKHVTTTIKRHGNLNKFSQQTFEKLNDRITKWYFQATNHHNLDALTQLMNKQNKIEYLAPSCQREPKHKIICSICRKEGHNK